MMTWSWPFFRRRVGFRIATAARAGDDPALVRAGRECALITGTSGHGCRAKLSTGTSAAQVTAAQNAKIEAATWVQRLTRIDLAIAVVIALMGASLKWGGLI